MNSGDQLLQKLKASLKSALLVIVFLLSLFSLPAYPNAGLSAAGPVRSEQLFSASSIVKPSANYLPPAVICSCESTVPIAKQHHEAAILYGRMAFIAYNRGHVRFARIKTAITYPITQQYLSSVIG